MTMAFDRRQFISLVAPPGSDGPGFASPEDHAFAAIAAMSEGVVVQAASGAIVACNPAAERILGITREQLAGRTSMDPGWRAIHEDGSPFPGDEHPAMETLRTAEPLRNVVMGVHAQGGSPRWISVNTEPILDPDGRPASVVTTFTDITERKEAEAALRQKEEHLRLVFEDGGDAIFLINEDGTIYSANPAACQMLGQSEAQIIEIGLAGIMDPDDPRVARALVSTALERKGRNGRYRGELNCVRSDGTVFPVEILTHSTRAPSGGMRTAVIARDITERKRAEEDLRLTVDRLGLALEASKAGWWEWNPATGQNLWSAELWSLYGLDPKVVKPSYAAWRASIHPEDVAGVEEALGKAVGAGGDLDLHWRVTAPDGTQRWLMSRGRPLKGPDGRPTRYLGIVIDITEREEREEKIRLLNSDLEKRVEDRTRELMATNQDLEGFSYSVSHDLRAPLRAIEGFSAILVRDHGEHLPPDARRLLEIVHTNALRMSALIDDLLRFSRAGRSEMKWVPIDMTGMVKELLGEIVPDERWDRYEVRLEELLPATGDPELIRVVLQNLLANAVKYSGRREHAVIEVGSRLGLDGPEYLVKDNGAGFDMAYAHKLFGVFQRLHGASEFEGTGIGLALVKRIVTRHGGQVWADGAVGSGATFRFSLPLKPRSNNGPS